jgi:excisionase family DNA binding protein
MRFSKRKEKMKHINDYPDVLTVEQVKEILQIGRRSTYKLIEANEIRHFKIGNKLRIPKQCLLDYLNRCTVQEDKPC